jgi:hypothetical protein
VIDQLKDTMANEVQLSKALQVREHKQPGKRLTPPYIAAEPEVVWRDLHPENGEELKFVIVASDGRQATLSSPTRFS